MIEDLFRKTPCLPRCYYIYIQSTKYIRMVRQCGSYRVSIFYPVSNISKDPFKSSILFLVYKNSQGINHWKPRYEKCPELIGKGGELFMLWSYARFKPVYKGYIFFSTFFQGLRQEYLFLFKIEFCIALVISVNNP